MENFDPKKSYYEVSIIHKEITEYKDTATSKHPDIGAIESCIFLQKVNTINIKRIIGAINLPAEWVIQPPPIIRDVDLTELRKMPPGKVEKG